MHLTLSFNLGGKLAVIAGGGTVATRKTLVLLDHGILVRIISPELSPTLQKISSEKRIEWCCRSWAPEDLQGASLVIAATDSRPVNADIAAEACRAGIPVNVADAPELSSVIFPALLNRGELQVAVSTAGRSPAFAVAVRDQLAELIGDEYGKGLELLAELREKLLTVGQGETYNTNFIKALMQSGLLEKIRAGDITGAAGLIESLHKQQH